MSLAIDPSQAVTFRPGPPLEASILRDVVTADLNKRFDVCVEITSTVWAYGFRMCRTPMECQEWMDAYHDHLEWIRSARVGRWPQVELGEDQP